MATLVHPGGIGIEAANLDAELCPDPRRVGSAAVDDAPDVRRDERIRQAREASSARGPEREAEQERLRGQLDRELASIGPDEAQRLVSVAEHSPDAKYLGPDATPVEWKQAVAAARRVTIEAARRGETITYAAIKLAVYRDTGLLVGYSMFGTLVMETNQKADGVLLSSIVVKKDTGAPGSGLLEYARSQGFDEPVATMQRHCFEHFGDAT